MCEIVGDETFENVCHWHIPCPLSKTLIYIDNNNKFKLTFGDRQEAKKDDAISVGTAGGIMDVPNR